MDIENLVEKLSVASGYMLAISILSEGKLEHTLITKDFPKADMLASHQRTKELIVENLESEGDVDSLLSSI